MKAYKVFNPDWTCRDMKYEVGKTYEMEGEPELCSRGFHACRKVSDCFSYYSFDPANKVAEVELFGDIVGEDGDKQAANKISIVRELTWGEVLDLANTGHGNSGNQNSGNWNSGDRNSGDRNSGDRNSGNWNSGNRNSGNWNSGNQNSGNWNSGDQNSGDRNSGNQNSGNRNSGNQNSGNWNSGDRNSGNWNSGNWNSGNQNSGNWNSGDQNSGDRNSGDRNSGNQNSGNRNSGNWNSGNRNSGLFNSDTPTVRMFNKDTGLCFDAIEVPSFLYFDLTVFVSYDTATNEERKQYKKEIEVCGGFLKTLDYKTAFKLAWDNASDEDKKKVKALPNFDADIFFEISGIRV